MMQTSYWKQFEHGMLSRDATRVLVQATEQAADEATGLVNIENLAKTWKIRGFYPFLVSILLWQEYCSIESNEVLHEYTFFPSSLTGINYEKKVACTGIF